MVRAKALRQKNMFGGWKNREAGVDREQQKKGKRKIHRSEKEPGARHCNVYQAKSGAW